MAKSWLENKDRQEIDSIPKTKTSQVPLYLVARHFHFLLSANLQFKPGHLSPTYQNFSFPLKAETFIDPAEVLP